MNMHRNLTRRARTRVLVGAAASTIALCAVQVGPAAADQPGDVAAPTGDYALISADSSEDPGPFVVEVVQTRLSDDVSAVAAIRREVDWGEGGGFEPWASGGSIAHGYTAVGLFPLSVRLTDEAGNATVISLGNMRVTDDYAPRLGVREPSSATVSDWRVVSGRARDAGVSGVAWVRVKAFQHRHRGWFAYRAEQRSWVFTGQGRAAARKQAQPVWVRPDAGGRFVAGLAGLRPGDLELRGYARDRAGNRSKPVVVVRHLHR
ncbi:hypothetical protein [Nocardioides mesophilus]|uniref:PKD domain-containing protein n=1 Tax=Nocardioides mesophilus TaxID=433659 RepID=A0A7G9RDG9_9ACTN|nr:hypothetical protein [Nocardioides mesophilus]QNN53644.1 hypothetical protein H9L09_04270 [Nocardioides mesophilus]